MTDANPLSETDIASIVEHMNDDHTDAIRLYVNAFTEAKLAPDEKAVMTHIDQRGIDIQIGHDGNLSEQRIVFSDTGTAITLNAPEKARAVLVDMVRIARERVQS